MPELKSVRDEKFAQYVAGGISRNPIRPHYSLVTRLEMTEEGTNVEMNMDNEPERKVSKRGRRGEGRPTKRTPEVVAKIAEAVAIGLTDREAGLLEIPLTVVNSPFFTD